MLWLGLSVIHFFEDMHLAHMLLFAGSLGDKLIYNLTTVTVGYFSPQEVVLPYPGYSMYTHLTTYYWKFIHEYITHIIMVVLEVLQMVVGPVMWGVRVGIWPFWHMVVLEVESYQYHNYLLRSNLKFVYVLYFLAKW